MDKLDSIFILVGIILLIILVSIQYTLNKIYKILNDMKRAKEREQNDYYDRINNR